MRSHQGPRSHHKVIFSYAATIMLMGLAAVLNPKATNATTTVAPTTWTVLIDATSGSLQYSVTYAFTNSTNPPAGSILCPYTSFYPNMPTPSKANDLIICPGDTVLWMAKTVGSQNSLRVYIMDENVLDDSDAGGTPTHTYSSEDGGLTHRGMAHQNAESWKSHKYLVGLYDKSLNGGVKWDDPKILIGTGSTIFESDLEAVFED